jgi:hypothetical protein
MIGTLLFIGIVLVLGCIFFNNDDGTWGHK